MPLKIMREIFVKDLVNYFKNSFDGYLWGADGAMKVNLTLESNSSKNANKCVHVHINQSKNKPEIF